MGETGRVSVDVSAALELLATGDITVQGRLVDASNATLFGQVQGSGGGGDDGVRTVDCVYKPRAGERPLWDFPNGTLARREVAAFAVSEATGWRVVPPTLLRDGPFGPGMCQLWIDADEQAEPLVDVVPRGRLAPGWLPVLDALGGGGQPVTLTHADDPRLRRMAVLDVVINNADRKGGHLIPAAGGHLYGVDHGVTFHTEHKLRTVLWGWAGMPLDPAECATLDALLLALDGELGSALGELLTRAEVRATVRRVDELLAEGRLPHPGDGWPAIPWPPF